MSFVAHGLLGLLEPRSRHGYELRQAFGERFGGARAVRSGQIYSTLSRLERDGQVTQAGETPGRGPERKLFSITRPGVAELERWLADPEPADPYLQNVLFAKLVLALTSGRDAQGLLDGQRDRHLAEMRALTALKQGADLPATLRADFALFHLDADLRWIDLTAARLERLREGLAG